MITNKLLSIILNLSIIPLHFQFNEKSVIMRIFTTKYWILDHILSKSKIVENHFFLVIIHYLTKCEVRHSGLVDNQYNIKLKLLGHSIWVYNKYWRYILIINNWLILTLLCIFIETNLTDEDSNLSRNVWGKNETLSLHYFWTLKPK